MRACACSKSPSTLWQRKSRHGSTLSARSAPGRTAGEPGTHALGAQFARVGKGIAAVRAQLQSYPPNCAWLWQRRRSILVDSNRIEAVRTPRQNRRPTAIRAWPGAFCRPLCAHNDPRAPGLLEGKKPMPGKQRVVRLNRSVCRLSRLIPEAAAGLTAEQTRPCRSAL